MSRIWEALLEFSEGDYNLGTLREQAPMGNRNKYASARKETKKA